MGDNRRKLLWDNIMEKSVILGVSTLGNATIAFRKAGERIHVEISYSVEKDSVASIRRITQIAAIIYAKIWECNNALSIPDI